MQKYIFFFKLLRFILLLYLCSIFYFIAFHVIAYVHTTVESYARVERRIGRES